MGALELAALTVFLPVTLAAVSALPPGTLAMVLVGMTLQGAGPEADVARPEPAVAVAAATGTPLEQFTALKDRICACKDLQCVQAAQAQIADVTKALAASVKTPEDAQAMGTVGQALGECVQRIAAGGR